MADVKPWVSDPTRTAPTTNVGQPVRVYYGKERDPRAGIVLADGLDGAIVVKVWDAVGLDVVATIARGDYDFTTQTP